MGIFKKDKKVTVPQLTYLIIRVNVTEIDEWIEDEGTIEPISYSKWKRDQIIKEFQIQLLPTELFSFFHQNTNTFSSSPNANITIDEESRSRYVLYWDWNNEYFRAYIDLGNDDGSANYKTIFSVPINEILNLMRTGSVQINRALGEESIIEISNEIPCSKIFIEKSNSHDIKYTNRLFSLWVFVPPVSDFQLYE
jgi:hypothetical protein